MKKYLMSMVLAIALFAAPSFAAENASADAPAVEASGDIPAETPATPQIDPANLKQLVETLESDTARTEFLTNLKTLMEQQKAPAEEHTLPLTEQIGVRGFLTTTAEEYEEFLGRNNLSGSLINQVLGSVVTLMVMVILLVIEGRITARMMLKTERLGARIEVGVRGLKFYVRMIHIFAKSLIVLVTAYTLSKVWGFAAIDNIFAHEAARAAIANTITVALVVFLAALVWEAINLYLEYVLRQANAHNQSRAKTLLPIIRNIVVAVFVALFGLVLLSEIGINVTPLLAGAGVIGVAVGFGAQSMVKDFLTGFTIILEDIVRVGDVVSLGGATGVVEKITLRKIQLRDFAGAVYTIPYSEIKTIQNLTKDFSFYVMDIGVAYNASIDKVIEVLRQVDEDMRKDDAFSFMIMEPIEIAGVDRFADSSVVIKARIKTLPLRQWVVGREFNKRMKLAFDASGIEIPFPQRTINIKADPAVATAILAESAD